MARHAFYAYYCQVYFSVNNAVGSLLYSGAGQNLVNGTYRFPCLLERDLVIQVSITVFVTRDQGPVALPLGPQHGSSCSLAV